MTLRRYAAADGISDSLIRNRTAPGWQFTIIGVLARFIRILTLLIGIALVFCAVAAILLRVMPGPNTHTDYLVIGTIATFISLIVLFLILTRTFVKAPNLFFKRHKR